MFDRDSWHEILEALKKNKIRTALTAFGVFWGIFMLIIMLGSGRGLQNGITQGFGDFATNSFFMWTQKTTMPYKGFPRNRWFNFKNDDIKALRDNIPEIEILAPRLQGGGFRGGDNVVRGLKSGAFAINGDYPEWNLIDPVSVTQGRFINEMDVLEKRKVAVIGSKVYDALFKPGENPLGQYIRIQGVYFNIIGVFKPKNSNVNFGGDKDQTIFMPFTTLQKTYNYGDVVGWFAITSKENVPVSEIEEKVVKLMKQRHSVHPDDDQAIGHFNLEVQYKKMKGLFAGINGLIWLVGIGTLIAGVIGISNIMLVIVKERTKEMGIRRALGASPSIIIRQIIAESVFLTTMAGYMGLVIGVGLLELINFLLSKSGGAKDTMFKNPEVDFNVAIMALLILIISGVLAGIIPAKRAVKIKPIEALRDE
ncbi:MAG: ABC transporter permease [Lentimicrobiaceae bacterium]|nr:ABC transporter permease [Lentimicrobiaceae bacterium]